jgi:hypothetical protein
MLLSNPKRGATVSFQVRSQSGRKSFDKLEGNDTATCARAYAAAQRLKDGGWASIERITTETIERRR